MSFVVFGGLARDFVQPALAARPQPRAFAQQAPSASRAGGALSVEGHLARARSRTLDA